MFVYLCFADLFKENLNTNVHSLFAKIFFLTLYKFYRDYFLAEIVIPKPLDSFNLSKTLNLAFFC